MHPADDTCPIAPGRKRAEAGHLALERKELLSLLAQRIGHLPEMPRKVLALHYYENLRLADIAAAFGLTESRICQIHTQALEQIQAGPRALPV